MKRRNKASLLILLACAIFNGPAHSQTFIGPAIGYDLAKYESKLVFPTMSHFEFMDKGFSTGSTVLGIYATHRFNELFELNYKFGFTKKEAGIRTSGFVGFDKMQFTCFYNTLSVCYKPIPFLFLEIGGNYHLIQDISYSVRTAPGIESDAKLTDYGIHFGLGPCYKNLKFEVYYNLGLNENQDQSQLLVMCPVESLGLGLTYQVRLF
ncbi:MAG: hypothetical protein R2792_08450 [Saprospiraceae bacterium]